MIPVAQGWELDVERGPDWLFVRPHSLPKNSNEEPPLAENIWALLEQNFTYRLVLELDRLECLHSFLVGQLAWLHKRIHNAGGLMRISGLSAGNQEVLHQSRLDVRFPRYADREAAVMASRPMQPR